MKTFNPIILFLAVLLLPNISNAEIAGVAGTDAPAAESQKCRDLELPRCFPSDPKETLLLFAFENAGNPQYRRSDHYAVCDSQFDKALPDLYLGKKFGIASFRFHSEFVCQDTPGSSAEWIRLQYFATLKRVSDDNGNQLALPDTALDVIERQTVKESAHYKGKTLTLLESELVGEQVSATRSSVYSSIYSFSNSFEKGKCELTSVASRDEQTSSSRAVAPRVLFRYEADDHICNRNVILGRNLQEIATFEEQSPDKPRVHRVIAAQQTRLGSWSYDRTLEQEPTSHTFSHLNVDRAGQLVAPQLTVSWNKEGKVTHARMPDPFSLPLSQSAQEKILSHIAEDAEIEESLGLEFGPTLNVVGRDDID